MKICFFLLLVGFSLAQSPQCSELDETGCGAQRPNCYFNVNYQSCDREYSSGMDHEMCTHGFPGSYWYEDEKISACVTDPCIYWTLFADNTSALCNESVCEWKAYYNVKFENNGVTFVESYQCIRKSLGSDDNPCYMLGPAVFTPPTDDYCEHFDKCEITVIDEPGSLYGSYENCDLKEQEDCEELGVDQCSDESPTCFEFGGKCEFDRCLSEHDSCPEGCVERSFHNMTLVDGKAFFSETTQCINASAAASGYNHCYLIRSGYCGHFDDCEKKIATHGSHNHLICDAKKRKSEPELRSFPTYAIVIIVIMAVAIVVVVVVFVIIVVKKNKNQSSGTLAEREYSIRDTSLVEDFSQKN